MMRMVAQSAQIVGFGAGGLLLALASPRGALAIDAASFAGLGRAAALGADPASRAARWRRGRSMAGDSLRAVRSVLAHRQVRRIMLFGWLVPAFSVAPRLSPPRTPATSASPSG